jgi:hypothetical protein
MAATMPQMAPTMPLTSEEELNRAVTQLIAQLKDYAPLFTREELVVLQKSGAAGIIYLYPRKYDEMYHIPNSGSAINTRLSDLIKTVANAFSIPEEMVMDFQWGGSGSAIYCRIRFEETTQIFEARIRRVISNYIDKKRREALQAAKGAAVYMNTVREYNDLVGGIVGIDEINEGLGGVTASLEIRKQEAG